MIASPPPLRHLHSAEKQALIITLRERVAPILANNLLPHFTDHTVDHSDHLTMLVDALIEPLQKSDLHLNDDELVVLYSACFTHDVGMQHERAGNTPPIQCLNLSSPWTSLSESDRRSLLRQHHNKISASMVVSSVRSAEPLLGVQLTDDYHPSELAALCEAHTVEAKSPEYDALMADHPRLRMRLLSGLLRISDILDESRRRASRLKARTLELDVESQKHWWRHYYTEDVTLEQHESTVTVWFDFPPDHCDEYGRVVPELQMPWVEAEFANHLEVFHRYRLGWTLRRKMRAKTYSTTESMPEPILVAMIKELNLRRVSEAQTRQQLLLQLYEEARPSITRQLDELNATRPDLQPDEFLRRLASLANDMTEVGGHRAGWLLLWGTFMTSASEVSPVVRLDIGLKLAQMMIDDNAVYQAFSVLQRLAVLAQALPDASEVKDKFWRLYAICAAEIGPYRDTIDIMHSAEQTVTDGRDKSELRALRTEAAMLRGDISDAINLAETDVSD